MQAALRVDPSAAAPIWRQIEAGVRKLVASGILAPGDPVPSVRELARELTVNPATVAKAYQRLGDAGVLTVRRGEGTFVAERPAATLAAERRALLSEGAARYAALAVEVGASRSEAVATLESLWPASDGQPVEEHDA
jgi:GntR family transcriptional regulator